MTFIFPISYALPGTIDCGGYGSGSCSFAADGAVLDGNWLPTRSDGAVLVQRRVAHAGSTVVQLRVSAMTENQCYRADPSLGCIVVYEYAPIEASSTPFTFQVAEGFCRGDCDGNHPVTVDEVLTLVNIALGNANVSSCGAGDANHDDDITVNEILIAVNNLLSGCGS